MRFRPLILALVLLLALTVACRRKRGDAAQSISLQSTIFAGDPTVGDQFAAGFYGAENNAWRWTAKQFAVDLGAPSNSRQNGAELFVKLAVPDAVMQKTNSIQLSASLPGLQLDPETYTKAGQYTYTRDVPAGKLSEGVVRINFALDHSLPPSESDPRELGIIVSEVGLTAKGAK